METDPITAAPSAPPADVSEPAPAPVAAAAAAPAEAVAPADDAPAAAPIAETPAPSAPALLAPTAHTNAPADDAQTTAAAEAAVAPLATEPVTAAPPTAASTAPGHESDVRELNGTGVAEVGALAPGQSEAHDSKPPTSETAIETPSAPIVAAPGSGNPLDVKEEADLAVAAPVPAPANGEYKPEPVEAAPVGEDVVMEDAPAAATTNDPAPATAPATNGAAGPAAPGPTSEAAKRQRKSVTRFDSDSKPRLAGPEATEMTATQIKFAQNAIKSLKARREAVIFKEPVDWQALNIPHYPTIISHPMDLGTVDLKLALTAAASKGGKPTEKTREAEKWGLDPVRDVYQTVEQWEDDVRLVFLNSYTFNGADHPVSASAKVLEEVFEKQLKALPPAAAPEPEPVSVAAAVEASGSGKARRPSNPVPTIRRSSTDAGGRPKRDIHPPPSKDLPYNEPQSASSGRKRRKPKSQMTPHEQAYHARVAAEELKFCKSVITELLGQKHSAVAWVFYDLPAHDLDFAPAYYNMIKRPISLTQIRDKLAKGEYADAEAFDADAQLLFANCFTFNPPDSDVHVMGQKVKEAYEAKMAKMPQPRPMTPEDEDEDAEGEEDAEGDDDEEEEADEIEALRTQIAVLQARLKELEKAKAKKTPAKKPAAATKKRKGSDAGATAGAAAVAKKKATGGGNKKARTSSTAAAAASAASPLAAPAPKKAKASSAPKKSRASGGSKKSGGNAGLGAVSDDDVRAVTYEQKEELAAKITQMPDDRLEGALRIIAEDKPPSANDDEEIELDIDDLSPKTLYKLYRYVVRPKKKPNVPKIGAHDGRRKGTGGLKRKNLDEDAEAARIARLQEQLSAFDNAESAGATQPAGTHDDLVQSESSEEESDSESDYE